MLAGPLPHQRTQMHLLSLAHRGATTVFTLLLTALLVGASWSIVAAQERDDGLTWAPLTTPPPIATPPILSPTDQVDGFSMGDPEAPVVVEIWEDFQCPYCQRFTFEVKPQIVEQYLETGDVRLVFRNLAFLGNESHWAALAAALAADQNRFWQMHDYLFSNFQGAESGGYHIDRLLEMGENAGLDMEVFREGLAIDAARERFAALDAEAREDAVALGINATPTVVVNGVPLQAPDFATVAAAIDVALTQGADDAAEEEATAEPETEAGG